MIRSPAIARRARPRPAPFSRTEALTLAAILVVALAVRLLALLVLDEPVVSDALAYMTMAKTAITGPVMIDQFGNRALYSPGYPLLLSAIFRLTGASTEAAHGVNLLLGLASVVLTWGVARIATGRPVAALIAAAGMAVLIPAVAATEFLERENLSTPLLLLHLLCALWLVDTRRPWVAAIVGGIVFGCGLLAGVSTVFTGIVVVAAVALRRPGWGRAIGLLAMFGVAAGLVLAPWVARNHRVLGQPVLSTNAGNNLYIGNNPAATGYYISFADTPVGPVYNAMRDRLGELGLSQALTRLAVDYVRANPAHVAWLDMKKLVYFWLPDIPDRSDSQLGLAVSALRWLGAVQHLLILALAAAALFSWRRWSAQARLVLLAVLAFWVMHGLVYMITRYRAPAMPLMLVIAAMPVADRLARRRPGLVTPAD